MKEITWQTTNLSQEEIESILGKDYVKTLSYINCITKAAGCWNANMREHYAAYNSLAKILKS